MKTIMDAVIEFKGELPVEDTDGEHIYPSDVIIYCHTNGASAVIGDLNFGTHKYNKGVYCQVCSQPEYNTLVDELSTNFGRCDVNIVNEYALADKKTAIKQKGVFTSGQEVFIAQINTNAGVASQRYWVKEYWCDSGHQNEYVELGLLFHNKEEAETKCRELVGLPPLTPPIQLIDGEAYQFDIIGATQGLKGIYREYDNSFYNYLGDSATPRCTNIKPLTVEGE